MITREKCLIVLFAIVLIFCVSIFSTALQGALQEISIKLQKEAEKEAALEERRHQDMIKAIRESGK